MRTPFLAVGTALGIDSSYAGNAIEMRGDNTLDANSRDFPLMQYRPLFFDHIEINATIASGAPTVVSGYLTWDLNGDIQASNEVTNIPLIAGVTTPGNVGCILPGGAFLVPNAGRDFWPSMYLYLKTDTGTIDAVARFVGYLDG